MFWKYWNGYFGFDLKKVLKIVEDVIYESFDERKEKVGYLVIFVDRWIDVRDSIVSKLKIKIKIKVVCVNGGFYYGNFMLVFYIFIDFLYFVNFFGQIFLLEVILGNNFFCVGLDFIKLMFESKKWEDMFCFFLVIYCDFDIRQLFNL